MKYPSSVVLGIGHFALLMCPLLLEGAGLPGMTYQGHLMDGGKGANGIYDFSASLFDSAADPTNQLAGPNSISSILVTNGLFHLPLVFDAQLLDGSTRWLEIGVRTNGADEFVILAPRHELKSAPYAITAGRILAGGLASGTYTNSLTLSNPGNQIAGTFSGEGSNLTNIPWSGLSDSAQSSITNIARSAAAYATNGLSADQLLGYGSAPSFTATSPTNISRFHGPVSIAATNGDRYYPPYTANGNAALYIFQPNYDGPLALNIEGAFRSETSTDRYRTYFGPGNPGMVSNGSIILDGGKDTPPFHNQLMFGIFTDVPAAIELVNVFTTTNAFQIEASGPALHGIGTNYPVVFSVTSRGQMSLINPYGTDYLEPQLILTDAATDLNSSYSVRSTAGTFTIGSFDTASRQELPVVAIKDGRVGIGTVEPRAQFDVAESAYIPKNTAPFSVNHGTTKMFTNSNNRSQVVLQISFGRRDDAIPSCTITSTNIVSTNSYVISPLAAGDSAANITNLYTLPIQTNAVIVIRDTSSPPASIALLRYELFGH